MLSGGCLCGAVRYEIDGEPVIVAHCHCTDCQKMSGAGHTTGAMFAADGVRVSGEVREFRLESGKESEVTRSFCPRCGSPLFGRNSRMPDYLTVTAGTLDEPDRLTPEVAIFSRSKRSWDAIDAALPLFESQPEWKPA